MKKVLKAIMALVMALSLLPGASAWAAAPEEGIQPNMSILASGKTLVYDEEGRIVVSVTTKALTEVDKIYHIVTVNKNGENVMFEEEYSLYNDVRINTEIPFNAKEGDLFEIIVKHCAKDGSIVESKTLTTYHQV